MAYDRSFSAKVFPILMAAFDTYLSSIYNDRVYVGVPPTNPTFPCLVYQSQDGGGVRQDVIDQNVWDGLITFRSIDTTLSGAWNRILQVADALPNIAYPNIVASGYLIDYLIDHPMWFPIEKTTTNTIHTAAIIVKFTVAKG